LGLDSLLSAMIENLNDDEEQPSNLMNALIVETSGLGYKTK